MLIIFSIMDLIDFDVMLWSQIDPKSTQNEIDFQTEKRKRSRGTKWSPQRAIPILDPTMLGAKSSLGGKGGNITNQSSGHNQFSNTPWAKGPANLFIYLIRFNIFNIND